MVFARIGRTQMASPIKNSRVGGQEIAIRPSIKPITKTTAGLASISSLMLPLRQPSLRDLPDTQLPHIYFLHRLRYFLFHSILSHRQWPDPEPDFLKKI